MSGQQGAAGIPAARPVDAQAYRSDPSGDDGDGPRWNQDGDRWLRAALAAALVLASALGDLGPLVLAVVVVVAAEQTVRTRRTGVRWWTVLEIAVLVLVATGALVLTPLGQALPGVELAAQLLVGALLGAGVVVVGAVVRRRRAARAGLPTGA
ncbi:hypothetical protein [Cellulomonas phragmiteti]|uniref:Uncharacterized protein n=1 Tax=Cellulomonas phragmiteti TaxID=478780 RepID=A0ABQ4DP99_9CELL|nr:hypothetical protein [Cellulomonas phragmiteti]GIG41163.1 hypothetical protein Cph01nite_29250 [Cellulomonas phragmiteti]